MSWLRTSFDPPAIRYEMNATCPSDEIVVVGGPLSPGIARTALVIRSIAALVGASSALVTTTDRSRSEPLGHFSLSRFTACTPSRESGNAVKSAWPMCSRIRGDATATRTTDVRTAAMIGRAMTARTSVAQIPLPSSRSRPTTGIRNRFTPSPRIASVAGRKVSDPTTATKTTEIVPTAIERNSGSSSKNRPPIEIMTARPEKNTARPAVLLATSIAPSFVRPCRRSVRKRVSMKRE